MVQQLIINEVDQIAPGAQSGVDPIDLLFLVGHSTANGVPTEPTLTESADSDAVFGTTAQGALPLHLALVRHQLPLAHVVVLQVANTADAHAAGMAKVIDLEAQFHRRVGAIATSWQTFDQADLADESTLKATGDAVITAMQSAADAVNCLAFANAPFGPQPDLTTAQVLAWANANRHPRVGLVPYQINGNTFGGPLVAAAVLENNVANGYWSNPSGTLLRGITSTTPITAARPRLATAKATQYQLNNLIAITRGRRGYHISGGSLAQAANSVDKKRFIGVRQTFDQFEDWVENYAENLHGPRINEALMDSIIAATLGEIARMEDIGAINTGSAVFDPGKNTDAVKDSGHLIMDVVLDGVPDLVGLTVNIHST